MAREQRRCGLGQQIVARRDAGKTWVEVAAAVGLSHSRVRELHSRATGDREAEARVEDEAILCNVRARHACGLLVVDIDQCGLVANGQTYEFHRKGYYREIKRSLTISLRKRGKARRLLAARWCDASGRYNTEGAS